MQLIVILWTFSTLLLSALIRILVLHIPLPFPNHFLIFLAGCFLGTMMEANEMKLAMIWEMNPLLLLDVVIPIIMFQAAYFIHQETFRISFFQIAILVFFNLVIVIGIVGAAATKLFNYGWNWNHAVILSSVIVMPAPILTMGFLKRLSAPYKIQLFLELEALMGNIETFVLFKCAILYNVIKGDSVLPVHIVGIFMAPLLGLLASKLVAYWLARIVKDSVNEICIMVASIYLCYILAQLCRMSGVIAVVSMGISLTGKRSFMVEGTEKFLIRFLHVFSTYFNTNLVMISGIFFITVVKPNITLNDVGYIFVVFFILNIVRVSVILMMSPLLLYTGHCLTWSNILVMCLCNIRGSISIIMALCVLHEDFKITSAKKMFIQALGQIVLSLLINSVITNAVIRYDVFVSEDESKTQIINRTLEMLNNLRHNTITCFKHQNKFIADADWLEVEKFTAIQHPFVFSKHFKLVKSGDVDPQKAEKIAIERILTMMKCSYLRQYEEGLMSRHSVKGMLRWSRRALAKGNSLIFPLMVSSALKIPHHLQFMKKELWSKLKELMFLERYARKLGIVLRTCVIFLHFVDVTVTVMHMADEIFIHNRRHRFAFFYYNLAFVSFNCGILMLRYVIKRVMSLWETITFFIVPIGIVDVMALYILATEKPVFRFIRFTLATSRLIRILQIGEVCPALIKLLLEVCEEHIRRHLSDGYDVGRSYIRGRQDVIRSLVNVDMDMSEVALKKLLKTCTEHKLEAIRMMGYLQMRHPVVAASSKTRQAMRVVLRQMLKTLQHLQKERAIGHQDASSLEKNILTLLMLVNARLHLVSPPTKDQIIFNVPWIKDNSELFEIIMEKGRLMHFKPSDIIVTQLHSTTGIYIILDGLAVVVRLLSQHKKVVNEVICDYLMSGNVIGEFQFLTRRAGHKTIICETDVLAWYIRFDHLWKYIREIPGYKKDQLSSLETRIWKVVAIKLACRVLMNEHDWFNINRTQIMTDLSESKIVSLSGTSATLSSYVCNSDVVVIQGKVLERGVNEVFHGPLYIPRGQTSFDIAQDSELPILLVLQSGSDNEDEYKFGPHFGDWRKSVVDYDNVSEVTLSSGTSHEKPSYKNVEQYYHCSNCSVRISRSSISINSWSPGSETQSALFFV
ncbi:sodium/hydrogen exchanger 10-like isoform X2 [Biomphalaria glabrata]|uniref:Sodium/hydrogen exchanger 10-like isoform X2 n=1 Tax=Biomphalaria glabrata TaxID=6526 RepID=A0A9W3BK45_BIOGL|nr:sodium/hydrogen exchanger 10-like isoform X2 [Biomphalaria glabrata]